MKGKINHPMMPPREEEEYDGQFGPVGKVNDMDPFPVNSKKEKALEDLFMLGYVEGEKKVGGCVFKFRTLTNEENQMVVNKLNSSENAFDAQDVMLAFAISSVNDKPFDTLYAGEDYERLSPVERKIAIVKMMQSQVVNSLVDYYNTLVAESRKEISEEDIKK